MTSMQIVEGEKVFYLLDLDFGWGWDKPGAARVHLGVLRMKRILGKAELRDGENWRPDDIARAPESHCA